MKKNFLLIVCAVAFVLGFSSCGGNSEEKVAEITLNEDLRYVVNVIGEEDDFFEPVAGIYPINEKDGKLQVVIEFEKSKNTTKTKYTADDFTLNPLDNNEKHIQFNNKYVEFNADNKQNALKELLDAKVGDHIKVSFSYILSGDEKSQKEFLEKIYTCDIDLYLDKDENSNDKENEAENESSYDEQDQSTSSNDWDSILDEYENYVDKTIALCNKINNGDMSAMSEYTSLLQSSQELNNKLTQGQGSMTAAQVARYTKISTKMANAAIKM